MPPAYVKPYVKRQKNDATDAEAICEAVGRANMLFGAGKFESEGKFVGGWGGVEVVFGLGGGRELGPGFTSDKCHYRILFFRVRERGRWR
jgi:hypothetical protein